MNQFNNQNENLVQSASGYLQEGQYFFKKFTLNFINIIFMDKLQLEKSFPFPSKMNIFEKKFVNEIKTIQFLISNDYRSYAVHAPENKTKNIENWMNRIFPSEHSEQLRSEGNKALQNKDFLDAAKLYSDAIMSAPLYSLDYSFAHSNRSIALMKLGDYNKAFDDCEIAKKSFYPTQKLNKLLDRQALCAIELKSYIKLKTIIEEIEHFQTQFEKNVDGNGKLNSYKAVMQKMSNEIFEVDKPEHQHLLPDTTETINENINTNGECVTVTKNIKKDEFIFKEKAYCFAPIISVLSKNGTCSNCAKIITFPFGCSNCKFARYCNLKCLNEDFNVHKFECIGNVLQFIGQFEISLALRTFINMWREIKDVLCKNESMKNSNPEQFFNKILENIDLFKFKNIFKENILQNSSCEFVTKCGLVSIVMMTYLKLETTLFKNISSDLREIMKMDIDWEILFSSIFMRIYSQLLKTNTLISTMQKNSTVFLENESPMFYLHEYYYIEVQCMLGIFPNILKLRHSCDPNIIFRFDNDEATVYAIKDIKKDRELLTCYGPHYKLMPTATRRKILHNKQYECNCIKCQGQENFDYYICIKSNCKAKTYKNDGTKHNLMKQSEIFTCVECGNCENTWVYEIQQIVSASERRNTDQFMLCLQYYEKASAIMSKYHTLKEKIAKSMIEAFINIALQNNYVIHKKYTELLLESMKITKEVFGELTLEYVKTSLYLIDILAFRKYNNLPKIGNGLKLIEKYPKVVSKEVKENIDKYIKNYITSK